MILQLEGKQLIETMKYVPSLKTIEYNSYIHEKSVCFPKRSAARECCSLLVDDLMFFIDFWCLTPLSAMFQLDHGDQF